MNKIIFALASLLLLSVYNTFGQVEKPPVYPGCEQETIQNMHSCFNYGLKKDLLDNFRVPEVVQRENYRGRMNIIFIVTKEGNFEVLYVNSMYPELEAEVERVFQTLPRVKPATYNGRPIDERYQVPLNIPLEDNVPEEVTAVLEDQSPVEEPMKDLQDTLFPEFQSELNIPFVHQEYDDIIYQLNQYENSHTASKPYLFNEVRPHMDLEAKRNAILKDKSSWGGRKL